MSRRPNIPSSNQSLPRMEREEIAIGRQVVAQVKAFLQAGRYQPGDRLPGERDMAQQLGVSRNSLREALSTLTVLGVLETRQGSGTRIRPDGTHALTEAFALMTALDRPGYYELHKAREIIEIYCAGRAAEVRDAEDLGRLEAILKELHTHAADPAPDHLAAGMANYRFHQAIAAAAHNTVLERILVSLHDARRTFFRSITVQGGGKPEYNEIHERLYEAIREHDSAAAQRAMALDMAVALEALEAIQARSLGSIGPSEFSDEAAESLAVDRQTEEV